MRLGVIFILITLDNNSLIIILDNNVAQRQQRWLLTFQESSYCCFLALHCGVLWDIPD